MRLTSRPVGFVFGMTAVALAGCATADLRPGVIRHESPGQIREKFHGPDVSVRALPVIRRNSYQLEPVVWLSSDSAYVVVGDIGDDGTLRIIYPERPGAVNLVKTDRFKAPAFSPRIEFPMEGGRWTRNRAPARMGAGNVFVIASTKPLDLTLLAEGDQWSLFDVYYENHLSDPKLAIMDLAMALSPDLGHVSFGWWGYGQRGLMPGQNADLQPLPVRIPRRGRPPA